MTASPTPPPVARPAVPILATVGDAFSALGDHPRETVLPIVVVQAPVAIAGAVVSIVLFLTAFGDEKYDPASLGSGGPLFANLVIAGVTQLFGLVGAAATIVSVEGVLNGRPKSLSQALDPAFTRMGQLLATAVFALFLILAPAITLIGIIFLPFLAGRLGVAIPALMLARVGPAQAIATAWRVTKGSVLRFWGITLLVVLPLAIPIAIGQAIVQAATSGASRDATVLIDNLGTLTISLLAIPLSAVGTVALTMFYLRVGGPVNAR
jgi:hypothetical protein